MCRKGENIRKRKDGAGKPVISNTVIRRKIHYGSLYGKIYGEVKDKRNKKLQKCQAMDIWCETLAF